jgi:hypothetical protein
LEDEAKGYLASISKAIEGPPSSRVEIEVIEGGGGTGIDFEGNEEGGAWKWGWRGHPLLTVHYPCGIVTWRCVSFLAKSFRPE